MLVIVSKCVVYFVFLVGSVYLFGFWGMSLGIIFLFFIFFMVVVSYIMVCNLGGDYCFVVSIIVVSILVLLFIIVLGFGLFVVW